MTDQPSDDEDVRNHRPDDLSGAPDGLGDGSDQLRNVRDAGSGLESVDLADGEDRRPTETSFVEGVTRRPADTSPVDGGTLESTTPHSGGTWKVLGEIDAPSGAGMLGHNTATTGQAFGLRGVTDSAKNDAAAVRAEAANGAAGVFASANKNDGVFGESLDSFGVAGASEMSSGVAGRTNDGSVPAIEGVNFANSTASGTGYGVRGQTDSFGTASAGVVGEATDTSGQVHGVLGVSQSADADAAAVRADAPNGARGVHATAADQIAVFGQSQNSFGLSGFSENSRGIDAGTNDGQEEGIYGHNFAGHTASGTGYGVRGKTDTHGADSAGVRGEATDSSGRVHGVLGISQSANADAAAVRADAPNGARGVHATAVGQIGVFSESKDSFGMGAYSENLRGIDAGTNDGSQTGIYGHNFAGHTASGTGYGVRGRTETVGDASAGVYGTTKKGSGVTYGVHGETSSTDPAAAGVVGFGPGDAYAIKGVGRFGLQDTLAGSESNHQDHVAAIANQESTDGDTQVLALGMPNITDPGTGNNYITFFDAGGAHGAIEGNSGGITLNTTSGDFAEYFPLADPDLAVEAGDVLGLESGELSRDVADAEAALVVTRNAAVKGKNPAAGDGEPGDHECVALLGQVPVNVDGSVEAGDLLVATGDGRARAVGHGDADAVAPGDGDAGDAPVVGRALEPAGADEETVEAFVGRAATVDPDRDEAVETLRAELSSKDDRIAELERENDELRDRLQAVEARVGLDGPTDQVVGDD